MTEDQIRTINELCSALRIAASAFAAPEEFIAYRDSWIGSEKKTIERGIIYGWLRVADYEDRDYVLFTEEGCNFVGSLVWL